MDDPEKRDEHSKDESLSDKSEEEVIELPPTEEVTSTTGADEETITVAVKLEDEDTEPSEEEPEPEPWPPFKNMPGSKKPEGLTVKERVPQFRDKVLKLYKRMKRGERLTEKQFAKRLKLKDPKDIQAAGIAWHFLFDEGKIAVPQFYKPLLRIDR